MSSQKLLIRPAHTTDMAALGQLMIQVYSRLQGFPDLEEQPDYYARLARLGEFAQKPGVQILTAWAENHLAGGVVYFANMAHYGAPSITTTGTVNTAIASHQGSATPAGPAPLLLHSTSGFRFLAVAPEKQGQGVGKALMEACIDLARQHQHTQVLIHSTQAMQTAWAMYEKRGFNRAPDLDFQQAALPVFGFRLPLLYT